MGSAFKMNPGWEQALRREMQKGVNQLATDWTKKLDQFHRRYAGQPMSTVKPALARLFRAEGINAPDADLTHYARQISEGGRITFKADRI